MPIRKFNPLAKGHPAIGKRCYLCDQPFVVGDETAPIAVKLDEDDPGNSVAELVHYHCALAAEKILGTLEDTHEAENTRFQKP